LKSRARDILLCLFAFGSLAFLVVGWPFSPASSGSSGFPGLAGYTGYPSYPSYDEVRMKPLRGRAVDENGKPVADVRVVNYPYEGDPAWTDRTGKFQMTRGLTVRVQAASGGCAVTEASLGMIDVAQIYSHPDYDTTIAAFVERSSSTGINDLLVQQFGRPADTVVSRESFNFGPDRGVHTGPTIVMKRRSGR
jgi:hypothetical protein